MWTRLRLLLCLLGLRDYGRHLLVTLVHMDYIIIKRKFPVKHVYGLGEQPINNLHPSSSSTQGWCNPLIITFTDAGKKINWENTRGYTWGLRLYKSGKDFGLIFKIKLLKTTPNMHKASIGPNPQLHKKGHAPPIAVTQVSPGAQTKPTTLFQLNRCSPRA